LVKILAVVGSARKKNTYRLTEAVTGPIRKRKGMTVELIQLSDFNIKHCAGCDDYCEKTGECKTLDDMQKLYPKLKEMDVLIIGSPTYFWNVSGSIKNFMDRCLPLYYHGVLKGKMGASLSVSETDGQNRTLSAISGFFQLTGIKELGSVSIARGKEAVGKAELGMAKALGERIVNQLT